MRDHPMAGPAGEPPLRETPGYAPQVKITHDNTIRPLWAIARTASFRVRRRSAKNGGLIDYPHLAIGHTAKAAIHIRE